MVTLFISGFHENFCYFKLVLDINVRVSICGNAVFIPLLVRYCPYGFIYSKINTYEGISSKLKGNSMFQEHSKHSHCTKDGGAVDGNGVNAYGM